jgi:hypothetical protein
MAHRCNCVYTSSSPRVFKGGSMLLVILGTAIPGFTGASLGGGGGSISHFSGGI